MIYMAKWLTISAVVLAFCGGCQQQQMKRFDIDVSLNERLRDSGGRMPTVQVDFVALGAADQDLRAIDDIDGHFAPSGEGAARRADLLAMGRLVQMAFTHENHGTQRLRRNDPMWDRWSRERYMDLMVLVDYLPDGGSRRLLIPLESGRWKGGDTRLHIEVLRTGLHLSPQPSQ